MDMQCAVALSPDPRISADAWRTGYYTCFEVRENITGSSSADEPAQGLLSMPSRLVALDQGPDILIDEGTIMVGRHPSCDARMDSLRLSRRHCSLTEENGEVFVHDLDSTNGIQINGERVKAGRLRPGDELTIAHYRYRFETDSHFRPGIRFTFNGWD
jgi:hypothetical protein